METISLSWPPALAYLSFLIKAVLGALETVEYMAKCDIC
jgi:hypothetical protein